MPEVITFVGYRPPPRYDSTPWTQTVIQEAATQTGTYTTIDTLVLSPVDSDPTQPASRSFTTENGTAIGYWYQLVFLDATGDTSQPTSPVQNQPGSTAAPFVPHTYATVAELQRVLQKNTLTPAEQDAMQRVLESAAAEIDWTLGYSPDNPAPSPYHPTIVDVNLDRAQELWALNYRPFAAIPFGPESIPIIAPRDSWWRHQTRLLSIKTNGFGVA